MAGRVLAMVIRAVGRYGCAMLDLQSRPKCSECPIRHRAVCARCDDDELLMLEQIKTYKSFKAGDQVLWRGDGLTYVASVVAGVASLGKTMEDGRTQMVGLLLPSDFIGRPGREAIDFDVVAVTDVTLCCFHRKPFEALIETTPHIAQRLMEMALDELDAARDWMLTLHEIANYLGLTLETVSRQLGAMKKERIVQFVDRRRFRVTDLEALHVASGDDCL